MQLWKNYTTTKWVISKAPDTLELTFNEPVNAEYSGITIYNDKGIK